jgi:hypothetical protein
MARAKLVLVGISKRNPHLHVFGTVERPDKPLMLGSPLDWELVKQGSTSLQVQACADHGSDVQVTRIVRLDAAGFHESRRGAAILRVARRAVLARGALTFQTYLVRRVPPSARREWQHQIGRLDTTSERVPFRRPPSINASAPLALARVASLRRLRQAARRAASRRPFRGLRLRYRHRSLAHSQRPLLRRWRDCCILH